MMKPCLQQLVIDYNRSNNDANERRSGAETVEIQLSPSMKETTATCVISESASIHGTIIGDKENENDTNGSNDENTMDARQREKHPTLQEEGGDQVQEDQEEEVAVDSHPNSSGTEDEIRPSWWILPLIVLSQFGGTSLWFAGNAILPDLAEELNLPESSLGLITSSVQFGFIIGTLVFAILGISDRFKPTKVFMICAILAAGVNALVLTCKGLGSLLTYRSLTGVCLAGIYPVGMKVAADHYGRTGLGNALGFLVGALVLGTGFPFILASSKQSWQAILLETVGLAAISGLIMGFVVPEGPYRKAATKFRLDGVCRMFHDNLEFRSAAFGYFGHQWELYAFWTYVGVVWQDLIDNDGSVGWDADAVSFAIISVGFIGCAVGGMISNKTGSAWVARVSLATSGISCIISPLAFYVPIWLALIFYLIWGITVVADSPQFSSLVAMSTPAEKRGSALTIVNCLGFAVTIGSIQLLSALATRIDSKYLFLFLTPGPVFGMIFMRTDFRKPTDNSNGNTSYDDDSNDGNNEKLTVEDITIDQDQPTKHSTKDKMGKEVSTDNKV